TRASSGPVSWHADAAKLPVSATSTKIRMACQRSTPVSRILMCRLYYGHRHARDGTPAGSESKMDGFGRRIRWLGRHGAADQHLALGHGGGGFADVGHLSLEQPGAAGAAGAGAATGRRREPARLRQVEQRARAGRPARL